MAISLRAVGATTAAAGAVTGVTAGVPAGLTSTDISILTVEIKATTAGTAPTITTPSGWTLIGTVTNNGTLVAGIDTGSNTVGMYYIVGTYTAPTITTTGANAMGAGIVAFQTSTGGTWDVSSTTTGSDTSSGTNASITGAANISAATGDWVIAGVGISGDIGAVTAETLTATGATIGTRANRINLGVTTNNDSRLLVTDWPVTAGTSSAAPVYTYSNTSVSTSHARFVRLREVPPVYPKIDTFTDDFATADTTKWVSFPANTTVSSGQLRIVPDTGYSSLYSVNTYDLTGSSFKIELVQPPAVGLGTTAVFYYLADAAANDVRFVWEGDNLSARRKIGGTETTILSAAYSSTNHRWLRISESGGVVTFATSPDGSTWTTFTTWTASGVTLSGVNIGIAGGYYGAETAPGTALLDNLNGAAAAPPGAGTATGTWTFTGTASGKRTPKATSSGVWTFAGSAPGKRTPKATAGGTWTFAGNAVGGQVRRGTATGTWTFTGSTTGKRVPKATATGTLAFAGTAAGAAPAVVAKTYYVAGTGGSDSNNGQSSGAAWATIAKVNATTFVPGDTILFQRGATFTSAVLLCVNSGTSVNRITYGAYGTGAKPVLNGSAGTLVPLTVTGNYVTVQDLEVRNAGTAANAQRGISWVGTDGLCQRVYATANPIGIQAENGAHRLRITDCDLVDNTIVIAPAGADDDYGASGCVILQADNCEVDHSRISGNIGPSPDYVYDGSAVEIYGSIGTVVHHNICVDNETFSELGHTRTANTVFHNNLITSTFGNAKGVNAQGTGTFGPVLNTHFHHNTVVLTGTTSVGLVAGSGSTFSAHNNIIQAAYIGYTADKIDEGHNLYFGGANGNDIQSTANAGSGIAATSAIANPLFIGGGDYHLQGGSPAINRGTTLANVGTVDLDGAARTQGAAPDAGAFERASIPVGTGSGTWTFTGTATGFGAAGYTLKYAMSSAAPTLPGDAALTASDISFGAGAVFEVPSTDLIYDPNKVLQIKAAVASTTIAESVTNNVYAEITVSRTGGWTPKTLRMKSARGGAGTARGFAIRSSVDGYTADLMYDDSIDTARPTLTQYTADISSLGTQTGAVTFRLYHFAPTTPNTTHHDDWEIGYVVPRGGTATGTWNFTGNATGKRTPKASATGVWTFTGAAVGKRVPKGTAAGTWNYIGSVVGKRSPKATAVGSATWTGTAIGTAPVVGAKTGVATGATAWVGTAVGKRAPKASSTGTWSFSGASTGKRAPKATISGVWTFSGSAAGKRTPKAAATGSWTFTGTATGTASATPGDILNIGTADTNHFDLQMARSGDATWTEITQAQIASGYSEAPYFATVRSGTAVQFSVPLDAPLVGTATGPRSELREVNADGTDAAYNINTGTHEFHGRTRIMSSTPDIVAVQIHNGTSDRIAIRTQLVSSTLRLRVRVNGSSVTLTGGSLDAFNPYVVGTEFEWKIRVDNGAISVYIDNMTTPVYTAPAGTLAPTAGISTWYSKAGVYAQATGAGTSSAVTELRDLSVTHTAGAAPGQGAATGSWAFTGAATGKRVPKATGPGVWTFTGNAVGKRTPKASSTGSWAFSGSAIGTKPLVATLYTLAYAGNTAAPTLPADGALTATSITAGAGGILTIPLSTTATTAYEPNKVISLTNRTSTVGTEASAVSSDIYFEFTVGRTGGWTPKTLRAKIAAGGTAGPRGFMVRSSYDGYTTNLIARGPETPTTEQLRPNLNQFSADLSGMGTQSGPITFRAYVYAAGNTNRGYDFDDIEIDYTGFSSNTATGTWSFTGSAVGKRKPKASATGSWTFTGAAIGRSSPAGRVTRKFNGTAWVVATTKRYNGSAWVNTVVTGL